MPPDLFRRIRADRDGSLAPTLSGRLERLLRPGWTRTDAARRAAAALLVLVAVLLLARDLRGDGGQPVVVAAHDLVPGRVITPDDVRAVDRPASDLPGGSTPDPGTVIGRTVSSPVRGGEILTDVRVLGPRLAEAATRSSDARVVPVKLADAALADLIREGDRVDVLTVGATHGVDTGRSRDATVLASGATVVLVTPEQPSGARRDRVVMLALPATAASAVAAASLTDAITVTLH